ncbi:MAG: peptidylprolyl isomerase [Planctomycetota bacterium]
MDPRALSAAPRARLALASLVLGAAACSSADGLRPSARGQAADAVATGAAPEPVEAIYTAQPRRDIDEGPAILLPALDSVDDVVAKVADLAIHKRHVYDRILEQEPGSVRSILEQIQLDALVARAAREWSVEVDEARVEAEVADGEQALRSQVKDQLGVPFDDYLLRRWGMTSEEYPRWLRTKQIRAYYREYVLRYAAMRQDRVEVRYIAQSDPELLERVATSVRQGADFATLAIRHSEESNRLEGGLLPPFGRGFDHPVANVSFDLDLGQLSEVFERQAGGTKRYYLVYCVAKLPGRRVPFTDVRDEIERAVRERPLSTEEFNAAAALLRAELKS